MLQYDEFKDAFLKEIKNYLPDDYKDAKIIEMTRADGIKGFSVKRESENMAPFLHLDDIYAAYVDGADVTKLLEDAARIITGKRPDFVTADLGSWIADYEKNIKDNMFIKLKKLPADSPIFTEGVYRMWEDLAIMPYIKVPDNDPDNTCSTMVSKTLLSIWKIPEDKLFEDAYESALKMYPLKLEAPTSADKEADIPLPMLTITNDDSFYGASAIVYTDILEELSGKIGANLLLLPVSVHEVLVLPDFESEFSGSLYDSLNEHIKEAVKGMDPDDTFSDHIYRYNKDERTLESLESLMSRMEHFFDDEPGDR